MEKIPEVLDDLLEKQYGNTLKSKIIEGFSKKRKTTIRINNLKSNLDEIKNILDENGIIYNSIDWYENALILNCDENKVQKLSIYDEGKIYLQSLSSMIPPIILNPRKNADILDMCAAPGGKTTELAALSNNESHITACELNKIRYDRLKYNIEKQGAKVYIMQKDSRNLEDFFAFDQILLDAPCTGSGTITLDDNIRFEKGYLEKHSKLQKTLLDKAIRLLKKGEELVYSTCSILQEENEDVIEYVKNKYDLTICPINLKNIETLPSKIEGTMVIMPNELYEGFFVAKLRKNK